MLLYTRMLILEKEFLVERCENLAGLTEILSRCSLDLVLLCQSVPDAECEEVIDKVRAVSPRTKVLAMHGFLGGSCAVHSDADMENLDGPPALLFEIHALLGIAAAENAAP
jgi:DNA-binding NtrC family response regulator